MGYIDGLSGNSIVGWACSTGINSSIDVHLYLGGAYGTGTFAAAVTANLSSEPGVAAACQAQGTQYRFAIPITTDMVTQHANKTIYVHGISPVGQPNLLINRSGDFRIPANALPTISLSGPANGATGVAPATFLLRATAADSDDGVASVAFHADGQTVNVDSAAPYEFDWAGVGVGSHSIYAVVRDTRGATTTSGTVLVNVTAANAIPTISLTGPANGATGVAPASFLLRATAGDSDDGVASVAFYADGQTVNVDPTAPYEFNWAGVVAGSHSVYAVVSDTRGATATSGTVSFSVSDPPPPPPVGPATVTRRYVYDAYQRLCKMIEPETGATVMGYDAAGNLAWSAAGLALPDANQCNSDEAWNSPRVVLRQYDTRNRLTNLSFPDGNGSQTRSYTPDGLPQQIVTYNDAGATSVINAYSYNKRRMLTAESSSQPGWYSWGIGYGYDANGSLAAQTYPTGLAVDYAPNALGQPTRAGNWATGVSYYPNGAIRQFTYGNGLTHTMTQNARQLPARVTDGGNALDFDYGFDSNGNVDHIYDYVAGTPTAQHRYLQYDGLDRLTAAGSQMFGGDHWHRYTYDPLDNLLSSQLAGVKEHNYVYDAVNRLSMVRNNAGAATMAFEYDVQGNLSVKNGQTYSFDVGNRLREATGKEYYRYDGLGRRVLAWTPSEGSILSQYSQGGQVMYQHDERKTTTSEYVYLGGSLVATRENNWALGQLKTKYQHTDALGSPVATTNEAGQVIDRTNYEPYGATIGKVAYGIAYTGHVSDAATGLVYMQQRYYDPAIGRFLSVDPISANANTGAGFNRYAYVLNNPYKFTDPDGRCEKVTGSHICGGGAAGAMLATSARSPLDTGANQQSGSPGRATPSNSVTRNEYKGSAKNGEAKQAVKLVGPVDALSADAAAKTAKREAAASRLPGDHNGPRDAFRHCTWNCTMTREIGADQARFVGDNHEAWGDNAIGEVRMDLFNNRAGREYGGMPGSCSGLCMQGVRDGTLMVAPPETRP